MLSENGHEVTVFISDTTVKGTVVQQLSEARIVRFNPSFTSAYQFLGNITHVSYEFAFILKQFIEREGKPDIIESQDYQGIGYFLLQFKACLYDWCKNIPVVITVHSPSFLYMEYNELPIYEKPNYWIGEMERFCIQAADLVIAPSNYILDELEKRFVIDNKNVHVVVNPFQFDFTEAQQNQLNQVLLNNDLTFYGKLSGQKGTFKILEEFKKLWDGGLTNKFSMIGGQDIIYPPLNKTMGQIVSEKYKSYIKRELLVLRESISPQQRVQLLAQQVIFIVPSTVDNLPYVVLELMSQGKILIVSKQGGQAEIVLHEQNGFVFDYTIPDSFSNTLNTVLKLNKEERKVISAHAVDRIRRHYSYASVYAQKIKLLVAIVNKHSEIKKDFPFVRKYPVVSVDRTAVVKTNTLLSIVIPYYNMGSYVHETIDSVLKSTYPEKEIILINDGSTDENSLTQLNKYRGNKQIKIIDKVNTGLADTRNLGAKEANGYFLAYLDSDDKVAPDYYEKAINILKGYENVDFVGAWTQYFGNSKNVWPTFNPEPPLIFLHNTINSSSLVYKRESFLKGGLNDPGFKIGLEDYESVIHMKAMGYNGVAIPEILFYYRVRENSMIKKVDSDVRSDYYQKILDKHQKFVKPVDKEIQSLITNNGAPLSMDNSTLENLRFQNIYLIRIISRKLILFAKANPVLKRILLFIKRLFR
jgi:glycosyltransferase involved in cell wall biosynthesis